MKEETKMKKFKFKITEQSLVVSNTSELEIEAKTERSAVNKLIMIRGNRSWSWELVSINGIKVNAK